MFLNVTHAGVSTTFPLETEVDLSDEDVRRVGVEMLRALGHEVSEDVFANYVIDRHQEQAENMIMRGLYLRPKVPFG